MSSTSSKHYRQSLIVFFGRSQFEGMGGPGGRGPPGMGGMGGMPGMGGMGGMDFASMMGA